MGLVSYAHNWESGELANTTLFQPMRMNKPAELRAIRTTILVYNDPTFTSLNCKLYSDDYQSGAHSPGALLHTSTDSRTKAELITLDYGVKETYFNFDDVPLQKDTWYNVVINAVGYSPTSSSYLAWVHAYPDGIVANYTNDKVTINQAPFQVYPIWSRF